MTPVPFEHIVGNPDVWRNVAYDLVHAGNILLLRFRESETPGRSQTDARLWRTTLMLYGLAAENFIKAMLAFRFQASKDGRLTSVMKGHSLVKLARQAGLPVPQTQEHLLGRLEQFIKNGKYPAGLCEGDGRATFTLTEPFDLDDTLQLLEYLDEELERSMGGDVRSTLH
ncbi:MAG: hypothetical protein WCP28_19385, partial [Actinomycetes bacterium]